MGKTKFINGIFKCLTLPFLFIFSCHNAPKKDDYSVEQVEKYKTDFFSKYAGYKIHDNVKNEMVDFISVYSTICGQLQYKSQVEYDIVQSYQIFTVKDSLVSSTFDYELIHFKNSDHLVNTIKMIKENNCIDDRTLKIHRIYKIGSNTLIGVSYSSFDISDYEEFLLREFDNGITIEMINISG
jgi:hypothetical protein